jgi:hypothetical protein
MKYILVPNSTLMKTLMILLIQVYGILKYYGEGAKTIGYLDDSIKRPEQVNNQLE